MSAIWYRALFRILERQQIMREILFKAKRKDNNEWVEGCIWTMLDNSAGPITKKYFIRDKNYSVYGLYSWKDYEVIPETVSQGTVLKNGLKIFENDIYHHGDKDITYTVVWHDSGLIGKQNDSSSYAGLEGWADRIKIVGNIFDEEVK